MKIKVIENGMWATLEAEGLKFQLPVSPAPRLAEEGESVSFDELTPQVQDWVLRGLESAKKDAARKNAAEDAEAKKAKSLQSAKWTVLIGHKSRCGSFEPSLFWCTVTKGMGNIINVLDGGHDIAPEGTRRKVVHAKTLGDLVNCFGGQLNGNTILTDDPGAVIGKGGKNVKFLSSVAARRLEVVKV